MIVRSLFVSAFLSALLAGCADNSAESNSAEPPMAEATAVAADVDGDWPLHGRTPDEQRYSPLEQINAGNVTRLGLHWTFDTGENRKHESTPIVVDGVMYLTAAWSIVHALDAATGEPLWMFDPMVPRGWARYACCGVVNRGVAVSDGAVFVGSLDGRLFKLDARSGEKVWEVDTTGREIHHTITGAPRVVKDKVIIGNGGGEYGVRGYISAYDQETGELAWRFWTVPGNPADPVEHEELATALPTWSGEWWKVGGGGTVWDSMAYDPQLDLLYVGTGNGTPWSRTHRSPGGGDNLYLSSILALDPDDGRMAWYYQTTPGDNWDYTATQHIMLADLTMGGATRPVLMQAPKNGFFYVLDRATGELIAADKYATVTWATHVDLETGRPVESVISNYDEVAQIIQPSVLGAHNWEPMAFNPSTGLVYIPAKDTSQVFSMAAELNYQPGDFNTGLERMSPEVAALEEQRPQSRSFLLAWDPRSNSERWRVPNPPEIGGGGLMSTGGNLVFQGNHAGSFSAYAADSGDLLWRAETGVGILAPPVSYAVDGVQYVAVVAGLSSQPDVLAAYETVGRVFTFRLDGERSMPDVALRPEPTLAPPPLSGDNLAEGAALYDRHCRRCHGRDVDGGSGAIPDLRYADENTHLSWAAIVLSGARSTRGMPRFDDVLDAEGAEAIRSYVVATAHSALEEASED